MAFLLTFRVRSVFAVDAGIKVATFNVVAVIAAQLVPSSIVYSMVLPTLMTFSVAVSNTGSGNNAADLLYKVMLLTVDDGAKAVALVLIFRIKLAPSVLAGITSETSIVVVAIDIQLLPKSREYSIDVVTPVIFSVVEFITELGAAARFASVIILASEATASEVGLTLSLSDTAEVAVNAGIKVETSSVVAAA